MKPNVVSVVGQRFQPVEPNAGQRVLSARHQEETGKQANEQPHNQNKEEAVPSPKRYRTIDRNGSAHPDGAKNRIGGGMFTQRAQSVHAADRQTLAQLRLSPRQWEVANLVACGLADCEIAGKLGISENTVGDHLKAIFRQHGVHTRTALAATLLASVQAAVVAGHPSASHERGIAGSPILG